MNSSRKRKSSQKRVSGRLKSIEGQVREISPTLKKGSSRFRDISPSPMRLVNKKSIGNDNQLKELSMHKLKETKLNQKLSVLMQEHASLKKVLFQTENNIKLKSAKIENEREKLLQTFKEYLQKKKIVLDLPSSYDPSARDDYSNTLFKSSKNSVSQTNADTRMMSAKQVIELNESIKLHLHNHDESLPSTLKAILRGENNSF